HPPGNSPVAAPAHRSVPARTGTSTDRETARTARDRLAERWEERLATPVVIAAAVSVPALFLAVFADGFLALIGQLLTWASLVILTAETLLLLVLAGHRWVWLRRHWWAVLVLLLAIPAMVAALAPIQALRLLGFLWQLWRLQILRVRTIVRAGRVLIRRLTGPWRYVVGVSGSLLAIGFAALVLVDPAASAQRERVLAQLAQWSRPALAVPLLGLLLVAGLGWQWLRVRARRPQRSGRTSAADHRGQLVGDRAGQFD